MSRAVVSHRPWFPALHTTDNLARLPRLQSEVPPLPQHRKEITDGMSRRSDCAQAGARHAQIHTCVRPGLGLEGSAGLTVRPAELSFVWFHLFSASQTWKVVTVRFGIVAAPVGLQLL